MGAVCVGHESMFSKLLGLVQGKEVCMGRKEAFWLVFGALVLVLWAVIVLPHMVPLLLHW
jgi:hypothetical protein